MIISVIQYIHRAFQVVESQVSLPLKFHPAHPEHNPSVTTASHAGRFPQESRTKRWNEKKNKYKLMKNIRRLTFGKLM